jgi:uncharacterized repeat protein (TIGR03803 family)
MSWLNLWRTICLAGVFCALTVIGSAADTFTTLVSFNGTDGQADDASDGASLVQGFDGSFYGTTFYGGTNSTCGNLPGGCGTVFRITPTGRLTTLYSFCSQQNNEQNCLDGIFPNNGLVQATNGNFYGTTNGGGTKGVGTVFEITPDGKLTTLHSFCTPVLCPDGYAPYAGLVQASNGNFYGTTTQGGSNLLGTASSSPLRET